MDPLAPSEFEQLRSKARAPEARLGQPAGNRSNTGAADHYRALFEATQEGLLVVDDHGVYVEVNEAYARLLKSTPEQVIGKHFSIFMPPDRLHEAVESFASIKAGGSGLTEFPLRATDGSLVHCEWTVRPHFVPGLSLCSARDITSRKVAEQALRASEARFRAAVSAVSSLIWTTDAQGQITSEQPAWSAFTGQSYEQYRGLGWSSAIHPDDAQATLDAWQQAVAHRRMFVSEHRLRGANGEYRLFSIRALPVMDDAGEISEWVGVHTDITERRRAEEQLKQREARFRFLSGLSDAMRPLSDPDEIVRTAATLLGEYLMADRVTYGRVDEDGETMHVMGNYARPGILSLFGSYSLHQFGETAFARFHMDQPFVFDDIHAEPVTEAVRDAFLQSGVRANLAVPLHKQSRLVAAIGVHQATPRTWQPEEVNLVQLVANRCWEAIERARVARELRESEARLRAIYDGTYEYIGLLSPDGKLLDTNRASLEFGKQWQGGIVGKQFWEAPWFTGTPGAAEQIRQAVSRAAGGEFVRYEAPLQLPSGEIATFDISLHPIRNQQGEVVLIVPEGRDITELKRTEAELRAQRHTFDTVLSNTPDQVFTFDVHGRFTYANRTLVDVLRMPLEEIAGRTLAELGYPGEVAESIQEHVQEVVRTSRSVRDRASFANAAGEIRRYEYILAPILSDEGAVNGVAGSSRDVTERERIEKALIASEERLQQVFAQAPVAICVLRGEELVVELANPYYQALLQGRNLAGRKLREAAPDIGPEMWDAFRRVLNTGEPFVASEWLIPYDFDGDGVAEAHWFNVVYNPLRELDGTVVGIVAVHADVTAQVLARRELERVNRELEEFAYVASHDLQEPLRMVNAYTQLLLRRIGRTDADLNEFAKFIRQGVHRMETLIQDLLSYSRTTQRDDAPATAADLSAALAEAVAVLKTRIQENDALVTVDALPTVRGDVAQLALVFQNLLSNALKYRKWDVAPEIRIAAAPDGPNWIVSVSDNGIGFDQQYAERIFGLFKRLHKDAYPGTGLGLAICHRIIERYGGRIWAEGKLGEGSTFSFSLPKVGEQ